MIAAPPPDVGTSILCLHARERLIGFAFGACSGPSRIFTTIALARAA
ncbi:MAG: hypothetical protein JWO80_2477 [Bryobacterales bacterium]|nr:hypothetical protein [Bryobacterales bacterium]